MFIISVGDGCWWVLMATNSFADTPQDGRNENKRIKKGTSVNIQKGVFTIRILETELRKATRDATGLLHAGLSVQSIKGLACTASVEDSDTLKSNNSVNLLTNKRFAMFNKWMGKEKRDGRQTGDSKKRRKEPRKEPKSAWKNANVAKFFLMVERRKYMYLLAGRYFEMRHFFIAFMPVTLVTLAVTILSFFEGEYSLQIGIVSAVSVFLQGLSKQLDFDAKAKLQNGAAMSLRMLAETMNFDIVTGRELTEADMKQYRDQYNQAIEDVGNFPILIGSSFARVESIATKLINDTRQSGVDIDAVREMEIMRSAFRFEFDQFCCRTYLWPMIIPGDWMKNLFREWIMCQDAEPDKKETEFIKSVIPGSASAPAADDKDKRMETKAHLMAIEIERSTYMYRLGGRYYEMRFFVFSFCPLILLSLAVAILSLVNEESVLAIGIVNAVSATVQVIVAQNDFNAKSKVQYAAANSLEKINGSISLDLLSGKKLHDDTFQGYREQFYQAIADVGLVPIRIENSFCFVDQQMKNDINAFKEEHKWARPNSKPVQELERVAMATAFRKLYDAFCSDSKCWPMHITGQVWLVCDRDWSNKVVNDTMAECFMREPEDNKANDEEIPGDTEVDMAEDQGVGFDA
jgi:hypothetical protein